jgi:hypothetical protein
MFKSQISRPNLIVFQKSLVTGPWDHKVLVSAKKLKKFMLVYLYGFLDSSVAVRGPCFLLVCYLGLHPRHLGVGAHYRKMPLNPFADKCVNCTF